MKRKNVFVCTLLVGCLLFTACGSSASDTTENTVNTTDNTTTADSHTTTTMEMPHLLLFPI